ncbi:uncharacterized protein LOC128387918 isoform X2 [Panonychus citri]|uniref:uncharacterized protein LOC128387918 isoform X2 n=1 Tax=Panonychus citri TaxID=50023 RepID=UPI002307D4D5|nr:uncharacterized protein LOC128387918 isoform X2 [Panonychus citri]
MYTCDASKSTKGASKQRRDSINAEIANLRDLLPLPSSTRQRLSQLQLMALVCVYVRKSNYFQNAFRKHEMLPEMPMPHFGFSKALSGFLMMMTQNGKLLYISDNAAEYLGHSMEELLIHGDSVYDIIEKQDHTQIQSELMRSPNPLANSLITPDNRLFLCRMNISRNARRQMRFGDQKVVLVQGHYVSYLPLCSRNEPVFLATCTPVAMPETRECVAQGSTTVFTSIHSMDMKFIHLDRNGEYYLGYDKSTINSGLSWYDLVHWEHLREAQSKHRLITQSEQEKSCILLLRLETINHQWIWVHSVLQIKDSNDTSQQPIIVCTNQVLSEKEATVMRANNWLYQFYSLHSKMHYGLTGYENHPTSAARLTSLYHQHSTAHHHVTAAAAVAAAAAAAGSTAVAAAAAVGAAATAASAMTAMTAAAAAAAIAHQQHVNHNSTVHPHIGHNGQSQTISHYNNSNNNHHNHNQNHHHHHLTPSSESNTTSAGGSVSSIITSSAANSVLPPSLVIGVSSSGTTTSSSSITPLAPVAYPSSSMHHPHSSSLGPINGATPHHPIPSHPHHPYHPSHPSPSSVLQYSPQAGSLPYHTFVPVSSASIPESESSKTSAPSATKRSHNSSSSSTSTNCHPVGASIPIVPSSTGTTSGSNSSTNSNGNNSNNNSDTTAATTTPRDNLSGQQNGDRNRSTDPDTEDEPESPEPNAKRVNHGQHHLPPPPTSTYHHPRASTFTYPPTGMFGSTATSGYPGMTPTATELGTVVPVSSYYGSPVHHHHHPHHHPHHHLHQHPHVHHQVLTSVPSYHHHHHHHTHPFRSSHKQLSPTLLDYDMMDPNSTPTSAEFIDNHSQNHNHPSTTQLTPTDEMTNLVSLGSASSVSVAHAFLKYSPHHYHHHPPETVLSSSSSTSSGYYSLSSPSSSSFPDLDRYQSRKSPQSTTSDYGSGTSSPPSSSSSSSSSAFEKL